MVEFLSLVFNQIEIVDTGKNLQVKEDANRDPRVDYERGIEYKNSPSPKGMEAASWTGWRTQTWERRTQIGGALSGQAGRRRRRERVP